MPEATKTFEYVVRDRSGKLVKGRIEANNTAAVANRLKTMGLAPVAIDEVSSTGLKRELSIPGFSNRVKLKDLSIMARQLATMITAGLSILRSLNILAELVRMGRISYETALEKCHHVEDFSRLTGRAGGTTQGANTAMMTGGMGSSQGNSGSY